MWSIFILWATFSSWYNKIVTKLILRKLYMKNTIENGLNIDQMTDEARKLLEYLRDTNPKDVTEQREYSEKYFEFLNLKSGISILQNSSSGKEIEKTLGTSFEETNKTLFDKATKKLSV